MELNAKFFEISHELRGIYIQTDKFKSNRFSLSFVTEKSDFSVTAGSLLSKVLCRTCKDYPNVIEMQKRLQSLYGASLSGCVTTLADSQIITFGISAISDKYALENEQISGLSVDLLCSCVFNPNISDGEFAREDFEIEKRLLQEKIQSKINEKRRYAIGRMIEKMCEDEPFGIPDDGTAESAEKITNGQLVEFWNTLLSKAPAVVCVVGNENPEAIFETVKKYYDGVNRNPVDITQSFNPKAPKSVRKFEEKLPVTQGKLVMGFRTETSTFKGDNCAMRLAVDIFGGGPYSRLFSQVREKQSLCYYCVARLYSAKGIVCVDSGVEFENFDKTQKGIMEQLSVVQKGEFDDELISASKMGICDALNSVGDSLYGMEAYYILRLYDKEMLSPEEYAKRIMNVSKEQIMDAAGEIKLDTVYELKGEDGEIHD